VDFSSPDFLPQLPHAFFAERQQRIVGNRFDRRNPMRLASLSDVLRSDALCTATRFSRDDNRGGMDRLGGERQAHLFDQRLVARVGVQEI
jgi:hypothetical protein